MTLRCLACGKYLHGSPACAEPVHAVLCDPCRAPLTIVIPPALMPGVAPAQQGRELTPPPEGTTAPGNLLFHTAPEDPAVFPANPVDPLCEECSCLLSAHQGARGECSYCACKVFVPVGPKS